MTGPAHVPTRAPSLRTPSTRAPVPRARALVVVDDPHSRDLLTLSLRLAGYDVATARSLVEARGSAWSDSLDLLVVDPGLPGLDGAPPSSVLCRAGREGRESCEQRDVPVILAAEPLRLEEVLGHARLHLTAW